MTSKGLVPVFQSGILCTTNLFIATVVLSAAFGASTTFARDSMEPGPAVTNVNERYTVESIGFTSGAAPRVSESTLGILKRLTGDKLNLDALSALCSHIVHDLHAKNVTFKVTRGSQPDHVKVLLDVEQPAVRFEAHVSKLSYNSNQGASGLGEVRAIFGPHAVSIGALTDEDDSVERFTGVRAIYELRPPGTDRFQFNFQFDELHHQFSSASGTAALAMADSAPSLYRNRMDFEPSVTYVVSEPLTVTAGYGLEMLKPQGAGAPSESVSSVMGNIRYRIQQGTESSRRLLEVGYGVRFASRSFGSGYSFVRHQLTARYLWKHDRQSVEATALAGSITGNAPITDRFVLGNSTTLRGWNKYDIDPLGGNRVMHGSVTYGYRRFRVFYDAGSIWSAGEGPQFRQSIGTGYQKGRFLLAVAVPLRMDHVEPVLIAGMNF